jgi:phenylalanyl-tRNA synthetase beta chain
LSLLSTGKRLENHWNAKAVDSDFYFLKGISEGILKRLGIVDYNIEVVDFQDYEEGVIFKSGQKEILRIGKVKAKITSDLDIKQEVFHADFNWDFILTLVQKNQILFQNIPRYPEVKRDLALLLDENITFDEIQKIAFKTERKFLKDISLFDVYTGDKLPPEKKSYAVGFILQDESKTLTDKQIDKIMNKIQANLEREVGAILR